MSRIVDCTRIFAGILLLAAAACGGNTSESTVTEPVAAAPAPPVVTQAAPAHSPVQVPPPAQQLPVAEDFEAEAEGAIDAQSYKQDLVALGREIEKDTTKK